MHVAGKQSGRVEPRWKRRLRLFRRTGRWTRIAEALTLLALLTVLALSAAILTRDSGEGTLLTPPLVAGLLIANLVPALAMIVLVARRFALARAAMTEIGGRGRLHTRLVALFSVVAAVPVVLVTIFASLLFQSGLDFWYSDRARGMLEGATSIARSRIAGEQDRVNRETLTMVGDLAGYLETSAIDSDPFVQGFTLQLYQRELSEGFIAGVAPDGSIRSVVLVNPYNRSGLESVVTPAMLKSLQQGAPSVVVSSRDRIGVVTRLPVADNAIVYAARVFDPRLATELRQAQAVQADYRALLSRTRKLQFRFNAALLGLSLLIVAATVWIALKVADRLVRPVGALVGASRRVAAGDLTARVPAGRSNDEVGTLANAFNRMTRTIEEQTGALRAANTQLESRRAFTEAVLSGVTAGVLSIDRECRVQLINRSAAALLGAGQDPMGRKLGELAPELEDLVRGTDREAIVEVGGPEDRRTLAVKRVRVGEGHVLTFDDITDQLQNQRRAAWADVARRIAHEIKNPLTPIQLAAERIKRRYGRQIGEDKETFDQLTGTIVRQVGDLRRMVDEFSSFARMPKPVFREEDLGAIARDALVLHEVAHPAIRFTLDAPDAGPFVTCDRRQLSQALTNLVKNAAEAVEARVDGGREVQVHVAEDGEDALLEVSDTGIGLPADRERITEPYMTTRAKGTGLGLAIVKKIVEDHGGTLSFGDRPGGGTRVTVRLSAQALRERLDEQQVEAA